MQDVFGDAGTPASATFIINSPVPSFKPSTPTVLVEEETAASQPTKEDAMSEVSHGGLSKSKVKRMNIDTLRDTCKDRGLSVDGTKVALQERIIQSLGDDE
jgi:hypothetical protein